jgi:hypothetical protein
MEAADLSKVTRWGKVQAWWLLHPGTGLDHFGVMAALATYADADGICDPSQNTLAKRLNRSRPWVNRVVAELVEKGLLEKDGRTRRNGGTTSCQYRLRMTPVSPSTTPVSDDDSPCHRADATQLYTKQNQNSPDTPADDAQSYRLGAKDEAKDELPDDAIEEHTALFIARCRAKGYAIGRSRADDTWLSWLIDDNRKARVKGDGAPSGFQRARPNPAANREDRYNAWATSASIPRAAP